MTQEGPIWILPHEETKLSTFPLSRADLELIINAGRVAMERRKKLEISHEYETELCICENFQLPPHPLFSKFVTSFVSQHQS